MYKSFKALKYYKELISCLYKVFTTQYSDKELKKGNKELKEDFINFFILGESLCNFVENFIEEEKTLKTPHAKNYLDNVRLPKINCQYEEKWVEDLNLDYFLSPQYRTVEKTLKDLDFEAIFK